jgi:maleamate amidohydrolase
MQKPALIIIDVLNDFLTRWPPKSRQRLTQSINDLAGIMREFGRPVVWVRQEFEADLRDAFPEMRAKGIRTTIRGTPACEIVSELAVDSTDPVVVKKRYSALIRFSTKLWPA